MVRKETTKLNLPNMKGKKLTIELIQEYVSLTNEKLLSTEYLGDGVKLDFQCEFGHKYSTRWQDFKKGFRCRHCSLGYNEYISKGDYYELHIVTKEGTSIAYLDECDLDLVRPYKWSINSNGYVVSNKGKPLLMHRLIMGSDIKLTVDHINRNRVDNRRNNLRVVTRLLQAHNKTKRNDNMTGRTGVSYHKKSNSYLSHLTYKGVKYQKYFSITKLGEEQAFKLACNYRLELENKFNFLTEK